MTEHISCQEIAEYEFLLAFSPSFKADLAAIYELFFLICSLFKTSIT